MRSCVLWIRAGFLLLCLCLLSSCASGTAHITVHRNGTADLNMDLSINREMIALIGMPDLMKRITEQFREKNMEVKPYEQGGRVGFAVSRTINLRDLDHISLPEGVTIEREEKKKFFYTKVKIFVTVDMEQLMTNKEFGAGSPENPVMNPFVKSLIQKQIHFEFLLTAPLKPGKNNAEEIRDRGRTLVWSMKLFKSNEFKLNFTIPNIKTISYSAGALIALSLLLWIGIRISRKRRRTA
ncbi:hypothetical protein [Bacillus sp. FJAT-28004]|uniref:hypothetical protein n=1 Tax=Bacillus sp. FJAT-28004 TaxID=1679165 RepID=UPI0006B65A8A|nr:hypothetical protein [Bacillus sp. FJAT-28004]